MTSFRQVWIPRFFVLSLAPALVMLIALVFYPTSELAKCPLLSAPGDSSVVSPTGLSITIQGHIFQINNALVFSPPLEQRDGSRLVFLGLVFDVTSGVVVYGASGGAYYNLTRDGMDVTRALLVSNLDEQNLNDNISDIDNVEKNLVQWLPFLLNKYPQIGVVVGQFFTSSGEPTKLWSDLTLSLSPSVVGNNAPIPQTEECMKSAGSVFCESVESRPKIIRHRGISKCACAIEEQLFSVKSPIFTVVHFEHCNDESTVCWPKKYEL
jgi:hypothetical protein